MELTKQKILELVAQIKIAKILSLEKHPNADRLLIVQIDDGESRKQIVTGANNFKEGDFVPYLGEGKIVPGFLIFENQEIILQKKPLRGIDSEGMILAEDEIGLGHDHEGIMIIKPEILNSKLQDDEILGKSLIQVMNSDKLNVIFRNAGIVEVSAELQKRIDLIMSIGSSETGGEVIGAEDLPKILTSGETLYTYDGFEPSGQMHIAQGVIRAINTNKMIEAGFIFRMWVADWFGYLNNKMGGDMERIKKVGKYFIEIWKAVGMNLDKTEFLWTSDFISQKEYWELVMKVTKSSSLRRVLKTVEIMGRTETDELTAAHMLYPCMQVADIFHVMKCQVTELGMDQRKINMLAREVGPELGFWKPVIVSHGMLQGLQKPMGNKIRTKIILDKNNPSTNFQNASFELVEANGEVRMKTKDNYSGSEAILSVDSIPQLPFTVCGSTIEDWKSDNNSIVLTVSRYDIDPVERTISMKMSKSKPDTAIFMTDSEEDVKRKIIKAYCPEGIAEDNPILDYCKQIIFQAHFLLREKPLLQNGKFVVERDDKFGGTVEYSSYEEVRKDFVEKKLFPLDLKNAVIKYLNELLRPVREHFTNNEEAKKLLEEVKSFQVTR